MPQMPRGLRNNNPGNIEFGPFARKYGASGSDGRFAIFPTMVMGLRAQAELLIAYSTIEDGHGGLIDTVAEAIYRYCPPAGPGGESRKATEAYITLICTMLDCSRNDEFDFTDQNFLWWMLEAQGEMEQGHAAFTAHVSDAQITEAVALAVAS